MKKSFRKKFVVMAAALAIATVCSVGVLADTTTATGAGSANGSVGVTANITPLNVSITQPITVPFAMDPNTGKIVCPNIDVTNNTAAPINVTVQQLKSVSGGSLSFTDVLPTAENWDSLSNADTKKFLALGVGVVNSGTGWQAGYSTTVDYAAANTPALMGTLASGSTGSLGLSGNFGKAFDSTYTANCALNLQFTLA